MVLSTVLQMSRHATMQTFRRSLAVTAALIAFASAACTETSAPPPDAPIFDVPTDESQERILTRLPRITLTGTAEYGAKLELTRKPAFATGEAPREHSAHPFTAEFKFENVPLREGVNLFSLVAVDWSGRRSEPAELVVEYEPRAAGLKVALSPSSVVAGPGAGRGQLKVDASFDVLPEEAAAFADREITFTLSGVTTRTRTARTDDRGIAELEFTGLDVAGVGKVEVSDGDLSASADFVVQSGPAARLELRLESAGQPGSGSADITVDTGSTVDVVAQASDASGNDVTAPLSLYTDAVGAFIEGSRIGNLRVPGVYRVVAAVNGALTEGSAGVSAEARLVVVAGAPASLVVEGPDVTVAGSPFAFTATVVDAFGNRLPDESAALVLASDDPQATIDLAQGRATLRTAGTQVLTATLPDSDLHSELAVEVAPGPAVTLTIALDASSAVAGQETFTVVAHEAASIEVKTVVEDAFGNAIDGPVVLTTSYDVDVIGSTLPALVFAGTYDIGAYVPNTAVTASIPFVIAPAEGALVELDVAKTSAVAGESVAYSAVVRDRFGNATDDSVAVAVDDAGVAATVVAGAIRVEAASDTAWTIRATAAGTDLADATASLLVTPASPTTVSLTLGDTLTVSAGDEPEISATVDDAFGNVIADPPLEFLVVPLPGTVAAPPGPYVSDGRVRHLVRAGQYRCVARVSGTAITSDTGSPDHVLTVVPGAPASLEIEASDVATVVGLPVEVSVSIRDDYGNVIEDAPTAMLTVLRDETVIATITDSTWTPTESGEFTLRAELMVGAELLADDVVIAVADIQDSDAPVITFTAPSGDRTVAAWPPAGEELEAGCTGAMFSMTADDESDIAAVWLSYGGVANLPVEVVEPAAGTTSLSLDRELCSSALSSTVRGEVLVEASAVDVHGHFARASGSWCIDPDAEGYLPAVSVERCAVERAAASFAGVRAIAANRSGRQFVLATTEAGTAALKLVSRFPYEGTGSAHLLSGHSSPSSVALTGTTAFTTTLASTGSAVVRTVGLTGAGGGATDVFLHTDSETDRFHGVLVGADGALYTTWGARTGVAGGSRIDRFPSPLGGGDIAFNPSDAAFAESENLVLTHLCQGATDAGLFAAGRNEAGRPVLARVSEGHVQTLWTAPSGALVRGCARDEGGAVLSLEVTSAPAVARSVRIDLAANPPTAQDVFTGFAAGNAPEWMVGPAAHEGRLFAVVEDGAGSGALLRITR